MPTIQIGSSLDSFKDRARRAVMAHFVKLAMMDGREPTQRAMDTRKAAEAKNVVTGGSSNLLNKEAAMRGVPVSALAQMVMTEANKADAIELARVEATLAVDRATEHLEIIRILHEKGVEFM